MTNPSWADYATHDSAERPYLWDTVLDIWSPCLGPTGARIPSLGQRKADLVATNLSVTTDWSVENGQYAVRSDGADGYWIATASAQNLPLLSVAFWFKPAAVTGGTGVGIYEWANTAADSSPYILLRHSGQVLVNNGYRWTLTLVANEWQHFALTRDSTGLWTCYYNGAAFGTYSDGGNQGTTPNEGVSHYFGVGFASPWFTTNHFDDMMYFQSCISADDVRWLASARGVMFRRRKRRLYYMAPSAITSSFTSRRTHSRVLP